jgi:hypothetical protein
MDAGHGTWNVISLCKAGSLVTILEGVSTFKLDLLGIQEIKWKEGGTELEGEYTFFYGKWNDNHDLVSRIFVHKRIISAVRRLSLLVNEDLFFFF